MTVFTGVTGVSGVSGVAGVTRVTEVSGVNVGCCGRFGRGASLYRHRSQLFGRLWVRLPLPT